MALSMCSSRYCSIFAPLFFLYFWAVVVFLGNFTFFFFFFDIFPSPRSTKEVTTENMSLNKWKAWPVENSEDMLKFDKKIVTKKIGSCDLFFGQNKFFQTRQRWISIPSTCLSWWPIHVPSTNVSSDVNNRNMIGNKVEISTHKHSSNGALYVLL